MSSDAAPTTAPAPVSSRTLEAMLERLLASMVNGPAMNCRPHNSRQRLDFVQLAKLGDLDPSAALATLIGDDRAVSLTARVPAPRRKLDPRKLDEEAETLDDADRAAFNAWREQQSVLTKLRLVADDARTYEQDTGVGVLYLGWPLLCLPPGSVGGRGGFGTRRIVAPIALLPINLTIKTGAKPGVQLTCRGDGVDLVMPNLALLSWIEQQTGQAIDEVFGDDEGVNPWREIVELARRIARTLAIEVPAPFDADTVPDPLPLEPAPRSDDDREKPTIVNAAVLGLYPLANQGLLRDTQAMQSDPLDGPVRAFLSVDARLDDDLPAGPRNFADERFVTLADPFQSRAVKRARHCRGLVVHGPPGTGKSQTISNIIGDHLARGQRVLFVCDKRTALDVVANRLAHIGLAELCAVVHDPQRDQRDLYRAIREQLDKLAEQSLDPKVDQKLAKLDEEIATHYAELTRTHAALMTPQGSLPSFHELVGDWRSITSSVPLDPADVAGVTLVDLETHEAALAELFTRARDVEYATNPWSVAAGVALGEFVSRPVQPYRDALQRSVESATKADATRDDAIAPFAAEPALALQAQQRREMAEKLQSLLDSVDPAALGVWSSRNAATARSLARQIADHEPFIERLNASTMDVELTLAVTARTPDVPTIVRELKALADYLAVAERWHAFFHFATRARAREVLSHYSLQLSAANARRLESFLQELRLRQALGLLVDQLDGKPSNPAEAAKAALGNDESLARSLGSHRAIAQLLGWIDASGSGPTLLPIAAAVLKSPATAAPALEALRRAGSRAEAIEALEQSLRSVGLLDAGWLERLGGKLRGGESAGDIVASLAQRMETLEAVLRIRDMVASFPPALANACRALLARPDAEAAGAALRKTLLEAEITRRLSTDPALQQIDTRKLQTAFDRIVAAEKKKQELVREQIRFRWIGQQQARLLSGTGTRLNSLGAEMGRRLLLRGQKALRLRQVIALGQQIEGGDPLFDLRPVWMASPETVAQLFPRRPVFDVVVFDEASQCRLEEALPVLTRGHRVVIAGDPKQLPPTRFFESAVATTEEEDLQTEQDLFEAQQSSVEDLLSAALNLSIQQSYLDVHYRSKTADLITFSNEQFYGSRLQPVPGHPSRLPDLAPIGLHEVGGQYVDRANEKEADKVVEIVAELLARPKPPSIGIACFNLVQRDLIVEKLDEKADEDDAFGKRLAEARERTGAGSFEGLFVKNLENVQGDERDHMIISTTYGPDASGKFRRSFGPLGQAGGGRRLNVLITRAREQIHLVTSIPRSAYQSLPPVPAGQSAGGAWLLFAYIAFAAKLQQDYAADAEEQAAVARQAEGSLKLRPTRSPSPLVKAVGEDLATKHHLAGEAYWGLDGFNIDLVVHPPQETEDKSIGVLCDMTRFTGLDDPVEWEIFRTGIHQGQGWSLVRVWSPQFFRDPEQVTRSIAAAAEEGNHR
jgi:hypothetical protein